MQEYIIMDSRGYFVSRIPGQKWTHLGKYAQRFDAAQAMRFARGDGWAVFAVGPTGSYEPERTRELEAFQPTLSGAAA